MTVALVAVCLVAVAAGVARAAWQKMADERRSVADYHRTLDTLRRVESSRVPVGDPTAGPPTQVWRRPATRQPPADAPLGPAGPGSAVPPALVDPDATALVPTVGAPAAGPARSDVGDAATGTRRTVDGRIDGGAAGPTRRPPRPTLVFDDLARPAAASTTSSLDQVGGRAPRLDGRRGTARALRWATAAVATAVVTTGAATLATASRHQAPTAGTLDAGRASPGRSADARHGHGAAARTSKRRAAGTAPATPTVVVPTSATRYQGTVTVPATSYQVDVQVTAPCWVQGTETATGTVVWSGVLTVGQSHLFSFSGPVLLEIGAADATLTIDGVPVALPTGYQVPYDLHLQPSP